MKYIYVMLGMMLLLLIPMVAGEVKEIPQGNVEINIIQYNVSFNYTLEEDKNLTILELNTSKEGDIVAYFDNKPLFLYRPSNDSSAKTYNISLLNGTIAIVGVNASNYNKIEETTNCTFVGWNKTLGYAFFLFDNIGESKSGIIKLKYEPQASTTTTTTTSYSSGGGGGSHHITTTEQYPGVAEDIKSEKIKEMVYKAKIIIGSEVDNNLSAKYLKNTTELVNQSLEIKEDCILIGGPVANPVVKKWLWAFPVKITNDYPGKNRGVIEKQMINDHIVILLAGSDRWGTKAAVEYFKTLDDIPDEPIFVEWKDGKAVKIEKP
ncbi:S-layer protein [Methanotorris igneus]|uniref:S-layer protein outer domain-containing protein n=1 Tax=Methanotorris igneus (strain DSM 5666 / JCM 11834 / Kol 5) TaxID=880724 RepID=F6BAF9_METIK|nr:S-layer protein [Methanotorris igneus]AEF96972.1 hypothetical protein Metig_1437 [Methanotorris igneus Kol 5]